MKRIKLADGPALLELQWILSSEITFIEFLTEDLFGEDFFLFQPSNRLVGHLEKRMVVILPNSK